MLATAAEMFAERGFAATTMRSIATRVGVLSGSLYHHFESKEAIVDEVISSYLDELHARYQVVLDTGTDPVVTLHELISTSLAVALQHASATIVYQNDGNYLASLDRFGYLAESGAAVQRTWLGVLEAGVASGQLRTDIEPRIVYRLMRDGIWRSVRWYHPTEHYPIERFAADCAELYLGGLVASGREAPGALVKPSK
jgi:AcrR family transcriptional regulator